MPEVDFRLDVPWSRLSAQEQHNVAISMRLARRTSVNGPAGHHVNLRKGFTKTGRRKSERNDLGGQISLLPAPEPLRLDHLSDILLTGNKEGFE